ncbi:hypothetical protein [Streptomyces sp. NRRL F-5053]|uniref:hypothetical protein n=1 Tax=Streptomyces sp. NRRL F-5053 TaxID=1463854 RepID=UPI00133149C1|nr:hypothetical protein [Streptomyces sp. NRRL F-5053]
MVPERRRRPLVFDPSLVTPDLQKIHQAAVRNPSGPATRLLHVTLNHLYEIKNGAKGTHRLENLPAYPDLSDCETTYVQTDLRQKPSHRLIWRERIPVDPRQPIVRQVIALGKREGGQAYYLAGERLNRPIGISLSELAVPSGPSASRNHALDIGHEIGDTVSVRSGLEFS